MNTPPGNADSVDLPASSRFFRRKLRRASFISPFTGERSNRTFTLREASRRLTGSNVEPSTEETPLLGDEVNSLNVSPLSGRFDQVRGWCRTRLNESRQFATSNVGIGILKCSLAYLLGSLATFVPAIHNMIGAQQDSKHMVATVTVWFHPARTIGSMHEATLLGVIALAYSWFISFTSMAVSMAFAKQDLIVAGHMLVLLVFLGAGLGLIAWVKQRLGHPLVNVACSLASLGCITILIKEGSVQAGEFSTVRVFQVLLMVVMGMLATTLVNIAIFPSTARGQLAEDVASNTTHLGEMLIVITRAFLSGRKIELQDSLYKKLVQEHSASVNSMKKNLGESKREWYLLGRARLWKIESKLVDCLILLSQDLGGLRSAAFAQFAIMEDLGSLGSSTSPANPSGVAELPHMTISNKSLHMISELTEEPNEVEGTGVVAGGNESSTDAEQSQETPALNAVTSQTPSDLFLTFLEELGPATKSLVYTLKQILDDLPFSSEESHRTNWLRWVAGAAAAQMQVNEHFSSSLQQAVVLYRESRKQALASLYDNRALSASFGMKGSKVHENMNRTSFQSRLTASKLAVIADIEEVSACCGHFSFALLDFAEDVLSYLSLLEDLKNEAEQPYRSWWWILSWVRRRASSKPHSGLTRAPAYFNNDEDNEVGHNIPTHTLKHDAFINPEKPETDHAWRRYFYHIDRFLHRDDVKFAIKVGIGAVLYALPAFLTTTRPFFVLWRGEWGLVTYMAICCMTIGASNTTGINRIIGTILGACLALIAWITSSHAGDANPFLLAFWGWIVSVGCFYLILAKNNGPMGRFILLTYNLGALYSYSLSIRDGDNDDDEGGVDPAIWDIVMHRLLAVIVGCLWGLVVTRLIWPISARRKLQNGITVLWLRMGLVWKRDPLALFLLGAPRSKYMDIREEATLQTFLANLDGLRKAAQSEYELRGPFPDVQVSRMIECTGHMLDAFHAMNVVISKNLQCTAGEAAVLRYTREERAALSGRISHLFSVLASSVKLEYPVNDVLPSIEHTRDRLLARMSEFRRQGEGRELTTEQDFELLYAYVLVTGQLWHEIQNVSTALCTLFGTLDEENFKLD